MEQNVKACSESIKRIKKKLEELGISYIIVDNGILCKVSRSSLSKSTIIRLTSNVSNCKCNGSTVDVTKQCPYKQGCTVVDAECPIYIHRCNCGSGSSSASGNGSSSNYDCLFRIRPSDIQNGLNLYAIMLHGETCELKMIFKPNKEGEQELIDTLLFLV